MQDDVGIGRSEESLRRALGAIGELRDRATRMRVGGGRVLNPGWHACQDIWFMLTVSEAIVRSRPGAAGVARLAVEVRLPREGRPAGPGQPGGPRA